MIYCGQINKLFTLKLNNLTMFTIKNQKYLFDLIINNTNNKDLDSINEQLKPFDIDLNKFVEHYIETEQARKPDLCDCRLHQLARIYEAKKIKPSPVAIGYIQVYGRVRHCEHDDYAKEQLGY